MWGTWIATGDTSTGTTTATTGAWAGWVAGTACNTTTASLTETTWTAWSTTGTTITDTGYATLVPSSWGQYWIPQQERRQLTKAERKQAAAAEVERRRVEEERRLAAQAAAQAAEAKRKEAHDRAEQLLLAHLSPEQERAWKEERAIFVTGQSGRRYQIKDGRAGNITEFDAAGKAIARLCVHVGPMCPNPDNVLAQKLALEFHEETLRRTANISRLG
jgi:hypothetical protein